MVKWHLLLFPMRNRGRCGKRFPLMSIPMRRQNGRSRISFYGRWDMRQGKSPLPMNLWRAALRVTRSGLFQSGNGSYQRGCICAVQLYGTGTSPRAAESRGEGKCPLQRKSFEIFFQRSYPEKGVIVGEIDGAGQVKTEFISLSARHDVRVIKGFFDDLIKGESEDFLMAELWMKGLSLMLWRGSVKNIPV